MSVVKDNIVTRGLSGKLGKQIVFRQWNGATFLANPRNSRNDGNSYFLNKSLSQSAERCRLPLRYKNANLERRSESIPCIVRSTILRQPV